jgi:diguanylate cyclase (GGDEF)-like protein
MNLPSSELRPLLAFPAIGLMELSGQKDAVDSAIAPRKTMRTCESQEGNTFETELEHSERERRVISIDRGTRPGKREFEGALASALECADREVGEMAEEVHEISRILRSESLDEHAERAARQPLLWSAMKQALVDNELRHLALTDELTCVYNRRGFFAAATQLLKLARRNTQNYLLMLCDLDNLEKINETCGPREGDLTLIRVADALENAFRSADVVARIGGDEFAVLAVETSEEGRAILLQRMEEALTNAGLGERRFKLSASIGVAQFDAKQAVSLGELLLHAHKNLREEKRKRQVLLMPRLARNRGREGSQEVTTSRDGR